MHNLVMDIAKLRTELGYKKNPYNANHYALEHMEKNPEKIALKFPKMINNNGYLTYDSLTFGEFRKNALFFAQGLKDEGISAGDRVILLFPVSVDLYLLIFACFYIGAVPVFIDVTMGKDKLLSVLKISKAKLVISVDELLKFRFFLPSLYFKNCYSFNSKRFFFHALNDLRSEKMYNEQETLQDENSTALITFTSGALSIPKGANRTIRILLNQKIVSEYMWPHKLNEIDMPSFPMIVLQNLGCGVSSILPYINFQKINEMNPSLIVAQITEEKITRMSAQPFFIEKIADYILKNNIKLETLSSIVVGGACVSRTLCKLLVKAFPNTDLNVVYGSTEAEPITYISVADLLQKEGDGYLVGKAAPTLEIKLLKTGELSVNESTIILSHGCRSFGEVILSGPHVIEEYIDDHISNRELKLKDSQGKIWHRTGDLGYFDEESNLWLLGRLKDQIQINGEWMPCYSIEEHILNIFGVKSAFINDPKILFIEKSSQVDIGGLNQYLEQMNLSEFLVKEISKLPVDHRHFSRVDRETLKK